MKKAIIVIVASVVILGLIIGGCAQPAPAPAPTPTPAPAPTVITWKAQSWGGDTYTPRIMMEKVLDDLEASGLFQIDYFPQEALMKARDAWDGMREGVLDIAMSPSGYQVDRMGVAGATEWLPRNFNYDKFIAHYRDPGGYYDFSQTYFAKQGIRLVSDQHTPPNQGSSVVPIHKMEDLKGLLTRDPGSWTPWLKMLGAAPVALASSEVYEAFQRGIVEAFISHSLSSYVSHKWYEVTDYVVIIDWMLGGLQLTMNNDVYNDLPAEHRALFDESVLRQEAWMFEQNKVDIVELLDVIKGHGVEIIEIPAEEMARWDAAIAPFFDSLAEKYGPEWDAFLKIQATLK